MKEDENILKQETKKALGQRKWGFRIVGFIVILMSIMIWVKGDWQDIPVSIGTVVLIIGIAIWMMGSPGDYNAGADGVAMVTMEVPGKIEEFYEAYRQIETPLGSAYLGKISTMKQNALIWGPDGNGEYLYFWLNNSGIIGYLGYSVLDDLITEHINEPEIPMQENENKEVDSGSRPDVQAIQAQLLDSLKHYAKTGIAFY